MQLRIEAAPATAMIATVAAGRRLITLPEVSYELAITPQCAPPLKAESVLISVADTQTVIDATEIGEESGFTTSITIPQQQNSPLAIVDQCLANAESDATQEPILIRGAFTVQGSLRCSDGNLQSIHYAAQPLDLIVECATSDDDALPDARD